MPTFDVTIGNKTYHVEIPDPGAVPLAVIVDGQPFEVSIVGTELNSVRAVPPAEPPHSAPAPAPLPHPPRVTVARPATPAHASFPVGEETPSPWPEAQGREDDVHGEVVAPMPGTILSVEVEAGQHVEAGQVLITLEAMKMKNPIRTTHPGVVAEIMVQPGEAVAYGDPLVRFA